MLAIAVAWSISIVGPVRYEYTLPNDFTGKITVIYHPDGPDSIRRTYFGKRTFTIKIPPSGVMVTPDYSRLFYMADDELWRYQDGRVIKRWPNDLSPGFTFVGSSSGDSISGIAKTDPLFRWAEWDSRSSYWKIRSTSYSVLK